MPGVTAGCPPVFEWLKLEALFFNNGASPLEWSPFGKLSASNSVNLLEKAGNRAFPEGLGLDACTLLGFYLFFTSYFLSPWENCDCGRIKVWLINTIICKGQIQYKWIIKWIEYKTTFGAGIYRCFIGFTYRTLLGNDLLFT